MNMASRHVMAQVVLLHLQWDLFTVQFVILILKKRKVNLLMMIVIYHTCFIIIAMRVMIIIYAPNVSLTMEENENVKHFLMNKIIISLIYKRTTSPLKYIVNFILF